MDRLTCLIGWTDGHAWLDELTDMPDLIPTLLFPSNIHQSGTSMRLFFTFYRDFVCMFMCALARACVRASVCARMRVCMLACVCMCARERERTAIFYQISLFELWDARRSFLFDLWLLFILWVMSKNFPSLHFYLLWISCNLYQRHLRLGWRPLVPLSQHFC